MMVSESAEKKGQFRLGVSGKMILNIAVPTAVILIILAIIVTVTVVNTVWGLKDKDIENQMEAVSNQVTQYFEPYFVSEKFVADRSWSRAPLRTGLRPPRSTSRPCRISSMRTQSAVKLCRAFGWLA